MAEVDIGDQNLRSLEAIRKAVEIEEGRESSLDEALSRVIRLYLRFVPCV